MPPLMLAGIVALLAFNLFGALFILANPSSAAATFADRRQWFTAALYRLILVPCSYDFSPDLNADVPLDTLERSCRRRAGRSFTFALCGIGSLVAVQLLQAVRSAH